MSNRRGKLKKGEDKTEINISPMIDMVFILLIFFIVTTVFVDERGINVDKPQPSTKPPSDEDRPLVMRLTESGQVLVEGRDISLTGVRTRVSERMQQSKVPVVVEVEPDVKTGFMIQVMDEAEIGGAERISVQPAVM